MDDFKEMSSRNSTDGYTIRVPRVGRMGPETLCVWQMNGKPVVAISYENEVQLRCAWSGEYVSVFVGDPEYDTAVGVFRDDGSHIPGWILRSAWSSSLAHGQLGGKHVVVSGGHDGSVRLWDVVTGQCRRVFGNHGDWVRSVAYREGEGQVVSAGRDGSVRVWDVTSGDVLRSWVVRGGVRKVEVARSNESSIIVSGGGDGVVRWWVDDEIVQSGFVKVGHMRRMCLYESNKNHYVVTSGWHGKYCVSNITLGVIVSRGVVSRDALINDMAVVHSGGEVIVAMATDQREVQLWNVIHNRELRTISTTEGRVGRLAAVDDVLVIGHDSGITVHRIIV